MLDELLRSRSTTVAAKRLGRTQSAVSHSLARLRATFDDPLLLRAGAVIEPTASRMICMLRSASPLVTWTTATNLVAAQAG